MQMNEELLNKHQKYINFWNAYASYNDLQRFMHMYVETDEYGQMSFDDLFLGDYTDELTCIINYNIRSRLVKIATETCELLCKAMLIENNKTWNDMKSLSHNILECYQALPEDQKGIIDNIDLVKLMDSPGFSRMLEIEFPLSEEVDNTNSIDVVTYLQSFNKQGNGDIIANIKSRYPGENLVDYNERFIIAFTKVLYLISVSKYTKRDYLYDSFSMGDNGSFVKFK